MKVGLIGLGKMGQQIAKRLIDGGHEVVASDINTSLVEMAVAIGAAAATGRADLVARLGENPVIWLMIPAAFVDAEIDALIKWLPTRSIIIDGGNSDYRLSIQRGAATQAAGIEFIDVGTSGGVLGLKDGFSLMVGGDNEAVAVATPLFEALAQPKGWGHFGPTGSGHFIKMVHNGIEYGVMEAYAEGYHLLHDGSELGEIDLAKVAEVWQHGSIINSGLNELAGQVLAADPRLEGIDGVVAQTGEALWTTETAQAHHIEVPVIQAALDVRTRSAGGTVHFGTKLLAALRHAFGGHPLNK